MAAPVVSSDHAASTRAAADSRQALEALSPPDAPLAGFAGTRRVPPPVNEPVRSYVPGSPEKLALKARLASMAKERVDILNVMGPAMALTGESYREQDEDPPPLLST